MSAAMATIIPFVIRPRPTLPVSSPKRAATIIIFPGVRYEREEKTRSVASNGRRPRKHDDWSIGHSTDPGAAS